MFIFFGNRSSPTIANCALIKTADHGEEEYGTAAKEFVKENFYVDDGLTSVPHPLDAIHLIKNTNSMLATAKLNLYKVVSNSSAVLKSTPEENRSGDVKSIDFSDTLPIMQRFLGVS